MIIIIAFSLNANSVEHKIKNDFIEKIIKKLV